MRLLEGESSKPAKRGIRKALIVRRRDRPFNRIVVGLKSLYFFNEELGESSAINPIPADERTPNDG
jgi:hypothetical protein